MPLGADRDKTCPACGRAMTVRRLRPVAGRDPVERSVLDWLRDYYALPSVPDAGALAERGHLDSWQCPRCEFTWQAADGSLETAVTVLTMGFTASGKSTYIASLGMPGEEEDLFRQTRSGATWSAFDPFYSQRRALAQTRMTGGAGLIAEQVPGQPGQGGAGAAQATVVAPWDALAAPDADEPPAAGGAPHAAGGSGAPQVDGAAHLRYRVFSLIQRIGGGGRPAASTCLMVDMPGEALAPGRDLADLANEAPAMVTADMVLFCVDPAQLDGLAQHADGLGLTAHADSPGSQVGYRLQQLAQLRSLAVRSGHGHLALVVLKADAIEGLAAFPGAALSSFPRQDRRQTWRRLLRDSGAVREWLRAGIAPGLVTIAEESFRSVSYHVVTATGCSPRTGPDGRAQYPTVQPRRVLDPIHYFYLMRTSGADA